MGDTVLYDANLICLLILYHIFFVISYFLVLFLFFEARSPVLSSSAPFSALLGFSVGGPFLGVLPGFFGALGESCSLRGHIGLDEPLQMGSRRFLVGKLFLDRCLQFFGALLAIVVVLEPGTRRPGAFETRGGAFASLRGVSPPSSARLAS